MLAQQLADVGAPAEIVHLDLSAAAQEIAQARAKMRGLRSIRFQRGGIEQIDRLELGSFDYIDCCGVLHHLEDPEAGLAALARALAPGGGIGLMVYGALGRIGVYHAQAILKMLADAGRCSHPARIEQARRLLKQLPRTNWLIRNPFVGDHLQGGDAGLYDLLLHARDRAYSVAELADLAASAGLAIVGLIEPARYDPASYLTDPALLERTRRLDPLAPRRARRADRRRPQGPCRLSRAAGALGPRRGRDRAGPDPDPARRQRPGARPRAEARRAAEGQLRAASFRFPLPRRAAPLLAQIDGRRSVAALRAAVADAGLVLSEAEFERDFAALYRVCTPSTIFSSPTGRSGRAATGFRRLGEGYMTSGERPLAPCGRLRAMRGSRRCRSRTNQRTGPWSSSRRG